MVGSGGPLRSPPEQRHPQRRRVDDQVQRDRCPQPPRAHARPCEHEAVEHHEPAPSAPCHTSTAWRATKNGEPAMTNGGILSVRYRTRVSPVSGHWCESEFSVARGSRAALPQRCGVIASYPRRHLPRDAGWMGTRRRCSEFRVPPHLHPLAARADDAKGFAAEHVVPLVTAGFARIRRHRELDASRADERERQRDRRLMKRRGQSVPAIEVGPGVTCPRLAGLPDDLVQLVDRAVAITRATVLRDLRRRWSRPGAPR